MRRGGCADVTRVQIVRCLLDEAGNINRQWPEVGLNNSENQEAMGNVVSPPLGRRTMWRSSAALALILFGF